MDFTQIAGGFYVNPGGFHKKSRWISRKIQIDSMSIQVDLVKNPDKFKANPGGFHANSIWNFREIHLDFSLDFQPGNPCQIHTEIHMEIQHGFTAGFFQKERHSRIYNLYTT